MVEIGIVNSNSNRKTNADKIDKAIRPQNKIKYFSFYMFSKSKFCKFEVIL
jgi:hypothetical protein